MKETKHTLLEVVRNEKIESEAGYAKWNTNIPNVFVYDVQLGWGFTNLIKRHWRIYDDRLWFLHKENAVIVEWEEFINNKFCGSKTLSKSKSFRKENYSIEDEMELTI